MASFSIVPAMVVHRSFWTEKIKSLWQERSIIWLSGIRRSGKTTLHQFFPQAEYFDCERPSDRLVLRDPETFLNQMKGKTLFIDEIHRLDNPSELLKLAGDYYPETLIIATGSSTLGASRKFKDTLTGRKRTLWLTPMISQDLADFGTTDLKLRLSRGGLPSFFLKAAYPKADYQEWIDSFWAKDIQTLFSIERRDAFIKFLEMLLANSGELFEATRFAAACEVSRPTISTYLAILTETFVVHTIRPFSRNKSAEIVSAPKVYGFDTGFVSFQKGWALPREDDFGHLWEHYVLNELMAHNQLRDIYYWRDKAGHEIDFVIHTTSTQSLIAIECKWSVSNPIPTRNCLAFLKRYPNAIFYVVSANIRRSFDQKIEDRLIRYVSLESLITAIWDKKQSLSQRCSLG